MKIACTVLRRSGFTHQGCRKSLAGCGHRCLFDARLPQRQDYWEKWYPADLISESFPGQFRNWFYSVIAQSTALTDRPAFENVFSYALMRDEKGEEMHKSKGNAIWFDDAAESIGVDIMRWLFTPVNPESQSQLWLTSHSTKSAGGSSCRSGTPTRSS